MIEKLKTIPRFTGFNLEIEKKHQSDQDWVFGALSPICLAQIPEDERHRYLPQGEVQRSDIEDMTDCASRAPINILEAKINWLYEHVFSEPTKRWLRKTGYYDLEKGCTLSDAFVAINSGTTRKGNSLIAPLEAIRKQGVIPKKMLPLERDMTWEDYHDTKRITSEMYALGLEFNRRIPTVYERVYEEDFEEVLKTDFLDVAGYAWPFPVNGEYPRTDRTPNHAFALFKNPKYNAFDNYIDTGDGDFIKKLAPDYDLLDFGYRIIVAAEIVNPIRLNWVELLIKKIFSWLSLKK